MNNSAGPEPRASAEVSPAASLRLNGWKDIAGRLERGVRTAQRWEKLYGLPVHRIGREGGEIVYAFADELDRWRRETRAGRADEPASGPCAAPTPGPAARALPPPAISRARRRALFALALGLLAVPAGWALRAQPFGLMPLALASRASRPPVSWALDQGVLTVRAEDGTRVFEHALGFDTAPAADGEPAPVRIQDVDGDGRREVLLVAPAVDPSKRRLYCFEGDGELRFVHQARGSVRFGDTLYAGPWAAERVFVTHAANGTPGLWLASAEPGRVPAWLQELGPGGQVKQEYRSDGRITWVSEGRFGARDTVFVGGTDADLDGASVAIFDREGVTGSAPASRAGFDCTSCPIGGPRDLLVFPRLCLTRKDELPEIAEVWVEAGEGLTVATLHRREPQRVPGAPERFQAHYMFDRTLALVHAEISREYQVAHAALERRSLVDHRYGARDDALLFPVRRFDGPRRVDLPPVTVGH